MARTAGRSRGCLICRQRRVKCDESIPQCKQCMRKKRPCQGPITGTFYVITQGQAVIKSPLYSQTSSMRNERQQLQCEQLAEQQTAHIFDSIRPNCPDLRRQNDDILPRAETEEISSSPVTFPARTELRSLLMMPNYYQPSRTEAFDQLFFSHFFYSYGNGIESMRACSWLSKLPKLLVSSFNSSAMRYSVRAACMAFYGILTGEIPIQTESRNFYARALESQRIQMGCSAGVSSSDPVISSGEAICTSIMMFHYEIVSKTKPFAWIQHLDAAVAMLEILGPQQCQAPFLHQLFRTVRLGVVYASVIKKNSHVFAKNCWRTIPFLGPKNQLDRLIDVFLSIPEYILLKDEILSLDPGEHLDVALQTLHSGVLLILSHLDTQELDASTHIYSPNTDTNHPNLNATMKNWEYKPMYRWYSDDLTAMLSALYHAAYVVCHALLETTSPEPASPFPLALCHSESVFSAIEYAEIESRSFTSKVYLSATFSLNVISLWSPSPIHRAYSYKKLEQD